MSLNPRETLPIAVLDAADAEPMPGPCFAIVRDAPDGPAATGTAPLFLTFGTGDLDALAGTRPTEGHALDDGLYQGVLLKPCHGVADLQAADVALGVIEAEAGLGHGTLSIIAVLGSSPAIFLGGAWLVECSARLSALVFDESALAAALGLSETWGAHGPAPLALARGQMVLRAAEADVPLFWSLPSGVTDPQALARMRRAALGDGFADVMVHGRRQWQALRDGEASAA